MDLLNSSDPSAPQAKSDGQKPAASVPAEATDASARVEALIDALRSSGTDITADYNDWLKVGFALAGEFGEAGRQYFHAVSALNPDYDPVESDKKFNECLKSESGRTDIATLFYLAKNQGVTLPPTTSPPTSFHPAARSKGQRDKFVTMSLSDDDAETMPDLPAFPESVFQHLPSLLKQATDLMNTPQERSLVLIGSIVTLSAALLPFRTIYFGKTIYPNLYLFVPGPAGSGKGKLDFCCRLVMPIHKAKRDRWLVAKEEYDKEYARYKRQKKGENIPPPKNPAIQLLRIPANSSATSFQQAMADNGNLLIFETEGDTVVNAFSSDYGDYSDAFRKAFAHESFGYLRRGCDSEEREIDNPRLSTVLSGTPEQVKTLIKDAENGLLSRFIFYCINATPEWQDGFASYGSDTSLEEAFDTAGERFAAFAKKLEETSKITFRLSLPQTEAFNDFFTAEKARMQELNGDRYSASTHRLAWCFLRIAMVLSALRMMDGGTVTDSIECTDIDFQSTLQMIRVISAHNDYIFNVLDRDRPEGITVADSYSAATRKTLLSALPGHFSTDDMKAVAARIGKSLRTVRRQVARAVEAGEVVQVKHGEYKKC